ncbi:hypothetical protein BC833DRAFT_609378 [Globomyces pollinis-pini]|nr:hypothetical protein BC833DRAFT_609378 [Globomyces pollinis-pini]
MLNTSVSDLSSTMISKLHANQEELRRATTERATTLNNRLEKLAGYDSELKTISAAMGEEFSKLLNETLLLASEVSAENEKKLDLFLIQNSQSLKEFDESLRLETQQVTEKLKSVSQEVCNVESTLTSFVGEALEDLSSQQESTRKTMAAEMEYLRTQNLSLQQKINNDKVKSQMEQQQLMEDIQKRISQYHDNVQTRWTSNLNHTVDTIESHSTNLLSFVDSNDKCEEIKRSKWNEFSRVTKSNLNSVEHSVKSTMEDMEDNQMKNTTRLNDITYRLTQDIQTNKKSLHQSIEKASLVTKTGLEKLYNNSARDHAKSVDMIESSRKHLKLSDQTSLKLDNWVENEFREVTNSLTHQSTINDSFKADFDQLMDHGIQTVQNGSLVQDTSTGKTPRKQEINIPKNWELTKSYDELRVELRSQGKMELFDALGNPLDKENMTMVMNTPTAPSKLPLFKPLKKVHNPFKDIQENLAD